MRPNRLRAGVERGEFQVGCWVNLVRNPAILTLMRSAGLDYARVDMQHSHPDVETIANFAILARALDFPIVVRPPSNSPEWLQRLLDAGVWNFQCAGVGSAKEAAEIVKATRYWPIGERGIAVSAPATEFELNASVTERMVFANKQVFITIMLESERAFHDLDEMAAMEGIDALTVGPTDLAQDMHIYGTPDENRIIGEKRREVMAAAKKHGKATSFLVRDADHAAEMAAAGVSLVTYKSDTNFLFEGFSQAARLKAAKTNSPGATAPRLVK